jgi:hypothetical protein
MSRELSCMESFGKRTTINMQVPEGFEKHNENDVVPAFGAFWCRSLQV